MTRLRTFCRCSIVVPRPSTSSTAPQPCRPEAEPVGAADWENRHHPPNEPTHALSEDGPAMSGSAGRRRFRTRWRPSPAPTILVLISLLLLPFPPPIAAATTAQDPPPEPSILAIFRHQYEGRDVQLEKMVMDHSTNRLYVGAVNHLFDINPDVLSVREHAVTGPKPDSVLCADTLKGNCPHPLVATNSHTKALAIYPDSNKLVECTSLYQGRCRTRNLSNIQKEADVKLSRMALVANEPVSSTVAFIGSGPSGRSTVQFHSAALTSSSSRGGDSEFGGSGETANQAPKVLYVGSTYVPSASQGPREAMRIPSLASLSLDPSSLFEYTSETISTASLMRLDLHKAPNFRIHYVGGFEANGFAYFATRQPKYTSSNGGDPQPVISKLARVCSQDANFYSYTEAPLECKRGGVHYNLLQDIHVGHPGFDLAATMHVKPTDLVLFGVFAKGEGPERNMTSRESALCVYTLRHVEAKFFENIRVCYNGQTRTNLPWFSSDVSCKPTQYQDADILCGKDVNPYIGGEIPISTTALLVDKTALFTSVTASSVQTATVAFIGTSEGTLHKALIEGEGSSGGGISRIYKSIQLTPESQPLLQDSVLDEKNGYLYAMSKRAVYKVNVRLCSQSTDCHSCLAASDPYCGWCMKPSACTTQEACDADAINPKADWLNYKSGRCPYIRTIDPREQQITAPKMLAISIENAPHSFTGELHCTFAFPNQLRINVSASSSSTKDGGPTGVTCPTPTRPGLKSLFGADQTLDSDSVVSTLAVVNSADGSVVASTNFTFYDCHALKSCGECASSRFPCDWCAMSARCVPNAEDACHGEPLVNSNSRVGPSSRRGPDHCPRFSSTGDIYVASGKRKRIAVQAHNLLDTMGNFKCQYTVEAEQKTHEKLASRHGDKIVCEDILFEFTHLGMGNGTAEARFDILWSPIVSGSEAASTESATQQHQLDNSQHMRVMIYKCAQLASNCGLCLGLDTQLYADCGWCENEGRCESRDSCPNGGWLVKSQGLGVPICPHPKIDDFEPKKGPLNGNTKITIRGTNLGLSFNDVKDAVRVANARCDVVEHDYVSSQRIVCLTRQLPNRQKQSQHVVFRLRDERKYTAVSSQMYTYADPQPKSFQPYRGPKSGGTDVTILGQDLDSGSNFSVAIGSVPCEVRQRSSTMVVCRTAPSGSDNRPEHVIVKADGSEISINSVQFIFAADPRIERIQRAVSILSGGILLDVHGSGFELLQRPRMVVSYEGAVYLGPKCEVVDEHLMVCQTPSIGVKEGETKAIRRRSLNTDRPLRVDYGFDLDGTLTGNLTLSERATSFPKLMVFDDPQIQHYAERQQIRSGGDLVVKGTNLNSAANLRDVRIALDETVQCNITAMSASTITCLMPEELPDGVVDVYIHIGDFVDKVGEASQNLPFVMSWPYWLMIGLAAVLLMLAFMMFVLYRRKDSSHHRQLRFLKNQMNSIEMKVAQECKEAFHELQTNMNALAGSMPQGASFIPFLSYQDYSARLLFPSAHTNHMVFRDLAIEQERANLVESGLRQLHRLLFNKTFLLSFVRTVDENKYLLLKDRVYIGSLLMVLFQERLDYATDVLKLLLRELIRRNVESRFQPKILFRRAESVAERMLSLWFSFMMYKFLRRGAGKQLYQLYWATKQQTEKGPQDALTLDARYSLSEEKLLRATFDFRELTIFVISEPCHGNSGGICDTPVRVLDCDSIGQVKEKCLDAAYRTTPYSERPSAGEMDLELRTPAQRLLLQDLDSTSRCEAGVWRYNTLAHYKVENKATLALVPRTNTSHSTTSQYNLSMGDGSGGVGRPPSEKSSVASFHQHHHHHISQSPTLVSHKTGYPQSILSGIIANGNGTSSHHHHPQPQPHHRSHHHKDAYGTGTSGMHASTLRVYHLVRPASAEGPPYQGGGNGGGQSSDPGGGPHQSSEKMVTEIYLTRLLTMKGTLQRFIENLLEMIFSTTSGVCPLPPCVKYMFDFLDAQAEEHGIAEPEVVHAWKSNALPLRFWVNLIKNPDFIFDIGRPAKIEGSLNVVAQTLMDACSTQDHHLTKDSPSSKLLFANEIERYKAWVRRYFGDIRQMPPIPEEEMRALLSEESHAYSPEYSQHLPNSPKVFSALNELYAYVSQQREMLMEELSGNEFALQHQLPERLQKVYDMMEPGSGGGAGGGGLGDAVSNGSLIAAGGGIVVDGYNSKSRLMSDHHGGGGNVPTPHHKNSIASSSRFY